MAITLGSRARLRLIAAIAAAVLGLTAFFLVFLVLTGIIAEPVTVIEHIVRILSGN